MASLLDQMRKLPDYRCARKKLHDLAEMLVCLIAAYCAGRTSVGRALEWCRKRIDKLRKYIPLKNGVASEPTISRMLSGIDEELFGLLFIEWVAGILDEHGIHVIIDGKALRGGTEKIKGGQPPYILNAIDAATQIVIAQLPIPEKANEITAIPELLRLLVIEGNIFTIDAIGTQKEIEKLIWENGGHFILQVKKNNPTLYNEIIAAYEAFGQELKLKPGLRSDALKRYMEKVDEWRSQEKNRERIEYRECKVCSDPTFLGDVREGIRHYIRTAGYIQQVRVPVEKDKEGKDITVSLKEYMEKGSVRKPYVTKGDGVRDDIQQTGIISDMEISAEEVARYKREHWWIENKLHHVLDDVFREDRSPAKKSKDNLALVRKYAYNILRIATIREGLNYGIQQMMDHFCDCFEMAGKYIFSGIESFY